MLNYIFVAFNSWLSASFFDCANAALPEQDMLVIVDIGVNSF